MSAYLELLRLPGARAAAIPAAGARLAGTMAALAVLVAALDGGRSYAVSGGASAAYAAGYAAASPLLGRLMDRLGTSVVARTGGLLSATVLVGLAFVVGTAPASVLLAAALVAGLCTPPVGASMRALWTRLTTDPALVRRAYALEATLAEALFIAGPAALTVVAAVDSRAGLVATAVLLGGGCAGYASAPAVRGGGSGTRRPATRTVARPTAAILAVLTGVGCTAAMCGALTVALAVALRSQQVATAFTGALVSLQAAASVVGGLVYGARSRERRLYARYVRLLVAMTATLVPLPAALLAHRAGWPIWASMALLCLLLLASGAPIAPTGAVEFQLIGEMTAQQRMTQAFAGVGSIIALGEAGGAAVAGYAADRIGPVGTLLLPAAFATVALVVTLVAGRAVMTATTRVAPAAAAIG